MSERATGGGGGLTAEIQQAVRMLEGRTKRVFLFSLYPFALESNLPLALLPSCPPNPTPLYGHVLLMSLFLHTCLLTSESMLECRGFSWLVAQAKIRDFNAVQKWAPYYEKILYEDMLVGNQLQEWLRLLDTK